MDKSKRIFLYYHVQKILLEKRRLFYTACVESFCTVKLTTANGKTLPLPDIGRDVWLKPNRILETDDIKTSTNFGLLIDVSCGNKEINEEIKK